MPLELRIPLAELLPVPLRTAPGVADLQVTELEHALVPTPPYVGERLARPDRTVVMIEQVARFDGEPLYLRVGYHPAETWPEGLPGRVAALDRRRDVIGSTREVFEELFGVPFGGSESTVEAVPCEARTARLLEVPVGEPVLLRETVLRDQWGVPWSLCYTHFRGDRYVLVANELC